MDPDPDPPIFVIDLQEANKILILKKSFLLITFFEGTLTSFFKDKKFGSGSATRLVSKHRYIKNLSASDETKLFVKTFLAAYPTTKLVQSKL